MRLPDNVFATLQAVCARYPWAVVQTAADLGAILNEVAWIHRKDPVRDANGEIIGYLEWGLSRKDFGTCVPSPVGLVAEDILQEKHSNYHWDVLSGAGVGYPLKPIQTDAIGPMTDPRRPWVAPVDPGVTPPVTPPVDTARCRFVPTDLSPLAAQNALLVEMVAELSGQIEGLSTALHRLVEAQDKEIAAMRKDVEAILARVNLLPTRTCRFL